MLELPPRPEWHQRAACSGMTQVMFPGRRDDHRIAAAICEGCPVREPCLDHALDTVERFGVWSGTTEKQRRRLRRARRDANASEERSA